MCGLCGYVERAPMAHDARERLTNGLLRGIEHRGRDATGFLAIQREGAPFLLKAAMNATRFCAGRPDLPRNTRAVIGHTRLATQGAPEWLFNNHPVRVGGTYLAHNGHVHNQSELASMVGTRPMQEVDSALLAALVDHSGPLAALDKFRNVEGAAAVTYYAPGRDGDVIVLARINVSPLHVWEGKSAIVWASTLDAIQSAWKAKAGGGTPKKIRAMAEGDALLIHPDGTTDTRTFTPGSDGWEWTRRDYRPTYVTTALPAHGAQRHGFTGPVAHIAKRAAKKAAKVKASPSPKGGALILTQDTPTVASCEVFSPVDYDSIIDAPGDGLHACDGCQDYYHRVQPVTIGSETFQFCASCAVWAEGAIWQ